jgi:hypothetical protein
MVDQIVDDHSRIGILAYSHLERPDLLPFDAHPLRDLGAMRSANRDLDGARKASFVRPCNSLDACKHWPEGLACPRLYPLWCEDHEIGRLRNPLYFGARRFPFRVGRNGACLLPMKRELEEAYRRDNGERILPDKHPRARHFNAHRTAPACLDARHEAPGAPAAFERIRLMHWCLSGSLAPAIV